MMNTKDFSIHIYHQGGKWILCRNDKCYNLIPINIITNPKVLITAGVLVISLLLISFGPKLPFGKSSTTVVTTNNTVSNDSIPKLNEENLFKEIKKQGIICESHVLAQAKLESYYMTSHLCKRANNLFGMRYPGTRPTTAIGVYLQGKDKIIYGTRDELRKYLKLPTYAVYANWTDAVADYKLWQDNSFKVEQKYLSFLNRIYAEAPDYVHVVDKMAKKTQQKEQLAK